MSTITGAVNQYNDSTVDMDSRSDQSCCTYPHVALPHHNTQIWKKQQTLLQQLVQQSNVVDDPGTLLSFLHDMANSHFRESGMCKAFAAFIKSTDVSIKQEKLKNKQLLSLP